MFGLPFEEIAQAVGRTPHASRQLASVARRHVGTQRRYTADSPERDRVVQAFALACDQGDVRALLQVHDPHAVARSDGGGQAGSARNPVRGADRVARFLLGILARTRAQAQNLGALPVLVEAVPVNGQTGLLIRIGGRPAAVVGLAIADDRVAHVDLIVNPAKLDRWSRPEPSPHT